MMRRVQFVIAIAIVSIFAAFTVLRIESVHAQAQYEVSCAAGTNPLPTWNTFNPVTGLFHANGCVDPFGNLTSPILGAGLQSATVPISSAQILTLNTAPTILIPAPGAGKTIVVVKATVNFLHGATAYTAPGGNLQLLMGTTSGTAIQGALCADSILNNNSTNSFCTSSAVASTNPSSQFINLPVSINDNNGNPTTGNGTLSVNVLYFVQTIQ
jgi:hypothetical protein